MFMLNLDVFSNLNDSVELTFDVPKSVIFLKFSFLTDAYLAAYLER